MYTHFGTLIYTDMHVYIYSNVLIVQLRGTPLIIQNIHNKNHHYNIFITAHTLKTCIQIPVALG